jgi:hypothetical protein
MVDSREEAHRVHERLPGVPLPRQHAAAFGGQAVEAAAALAGLFHPLALQPAAFFQAIQQRVERGNVELELAGGLRLDPLADLITDARGSRRSTG